MATKRTTGAAKPAKTAKTAKRSSARKTAKGATGAAAKTSTARGANAAEKMVKVDLKHSIIRGGRSYGPGKGVEVPASLADSVRHVNPDA